MGKTADWLFFQRSDWFHAGQIFSHSVQFFNYPFPQSKIKIFRNLVSSNLWPELELPTCWPSWSCFWNGHPNESCQLSDDFKWGYIWIQIFLTTVCFQRLMVRSASIKYTDSMFLIHTQSLLLVFCGVKHLTGSMSHHHHWVVLNTQGQRILGWEQLSIMWLNHLQENQKCFSYNRYNRCFTNVSQMSKSKSSTMGVELVNRFSIMKYIVSLVSFSERYFMAHSHSQALFEGSTQTLTPYISPKEKEKKLQKTFPTNLFPSPHKIIFTNHHHNQQHDNHYCKHIPPCHHNNNQITWNKIQQPSSNFRVHFQTQISQGLVERREARIH